MRRDNINTTIPYRPTWTNQLLPNSCFPLRVTHTLFYVPFCFLTNTQDDSEGIFRTSEECSWGQLHQNQTHLYRQLNDYADNDVRKTWSFWGFHLPYLFNIVPFRIQRRSVLEPTAKLSHTKACVLGKALGNLVTVFVNIVRVFLP
jgi:hypothetical protein